MGVVLSTPVLAAEGGGAGPSGVATARRAAAALPAAPAAATRLAPRALPAAPPARAAPGSANGGGSPAPARAQVSGSQRAPRHA
jgi:hypothetical protein